MTYKTDLQLAYSGKEIASERIAIIDSTVFENETAEQFGRRRREKYQKLLDQSDMKISEIKNRIAEDISAKTFQLESFKDERAQVNTRYQLREISHEEHEKIENGIKKKFDKVKGEVDILQQLCEASSSSEIGGLIPLDIDKDVDDYGNITRKFGMQLPPMPTIPTDFSIPSGISDIVSKVKQHDGISIQGVELSRGNLSALVGVIGVIIVILVLASMFGSPGSAAEECKLGDRYFFGRGGDIDYDKAVYWYTKAAERGYAEAQFRLGQLYNLDSWRYRSYNSKVEKDIKKAEYWFTKAADQGFVDAYSALGWLYHDGCGSFDPYNTCGVPRDYKKANYFFEQAKQANNARNSK